MNYLTRTRATGQLLALVFVLTAGVFWAAGFTTGNDGHFGGSVLGRTFIGSTLLTDLVLTAAAVLFWWVSCKASPKVAQITLSVLGVVFALLALLGVVSKESGGIHSALGMHFPAFLTIIYAVSAYLAIAGGAHLTVQGKVVLPEENPQDQAPH